MAGIKKDTLIINYLPQTLTDEELEEMFAGVGVLKSCKIVRDRDTGYSFGFGFVEYINESDAAMAIELLNGCQVQNKIIKVAYSRQGEKVKGANLHVRNLPKECTVAELETLFSVYGEIVQCRILADYNTGESRGVGFVLFNAKDQAEVAMKALNGTMPPGCKTALQVTFAEDKNKIPPAFQQQMTSYSDAVEYGGGYNIPVSTDIIYQKSNRPPRGGARGRASPRGGIGSPRGGIGSPRGGIGSPRGGIRGRGRGRGGPMRIQTIAVQHRYNPIGGTTVVPQLAGVSIGSYNSAANPVQGHIIYAYNIGPQTTQEELSDLFSLYGTVVKVDIIWDFQKNMGKGYGFVTMPNYEEAAYAIQCLNGYNYAGKPLQVSFKAGKV